MVRISEQIISVISLKPKRNFVETSFITSITERALGYIRAGYPVHLAGPTGSGKTTIAMHIASKLMRPVMLINGDESFTSSSFVGSEYGYRKRKVVDRFVERVMKYEESMTKTWMDERLTTACRDGLTVVYNEFTRSRPEANTVLLSILEEGILEMPSGIYGEGYLKVHPDFSMIFTSNPEEYAGVFRTQDALLDRMITVNLSYYDEATEIKIIQAKSGVSYDDASQIATLVRRLRESKNYEYVPTIRSGIMIAKSLVALNAEVGDDIFRQVCIDVLSPRIGKGQSGKLDAATIIDDMMGQAV